MEKNRTGIGNILYLILPTKWTPTRESHVGLVSTPVCTPSSRPLLQMGEAYSLGLGQPSSMFYLSSREDKVKKSGKNIFLGLCTFFRERA